MLWRLVKQVYALWQVRQDPVAYATSLGVSIGEGSAIFSNELSIFGGHPFLVTLGKRCFITEGVRFVTHDGGVLLFRRDMPDLDLVAPIVLGDDVYVGMRSIILPGTRVGNRCVIGAGSVVRGDVPGESVVAGVPARVIKPLSEYQAGLLAHGLSCGRMNPSAKEAFLKHHFCLRGGREAQNQTGGKSGF